MKWTNEHTARLETYLAGVEHIPTGIGTEEAACSVAAIRLAWDGVLIDEPPPCMSPVLAKWIIGAQDAMPARIRDSAEWRSLLPHAAGTGREREEERLAVILEWLFGTVLPYLQPLADERGFGDAWRAMCEERSVLAARAAAKAAADAAARAADAASWVAADAADAATNAAWAATSAADAANTARAAAKAANTAWAAADAAWDVFAPVEMLRKIIDA